WKFGRCLCRHGRGYDRNRCFRRKKDCSPIHERARRSRFPREKKECCRRGHGPRVSIGISAEAADSPPWQRRGGRAIKQIYPYLSKARTGWFVQSIYFLISTTPSAPVFGGFATFSLWRSHPLLV